eukprot:1055917-Rhodomonas_salina.2
MGHAAFDFGLQIWYFQELEEGATGQVTSMTHTSLRVPGYSHYPPRVPGTGCSGTRLVPGYPGPGYVRGKQYLEPEAAKIIDILPFQGTNFCILIRRLAGCSKSAIAPR